MKKLFLKTAFAGAIMMVSGVAHAACTAPAAADDLTDEQIVEVYDCIKAELHAGYAKSDNAWATDYTKWQAASTQPAAPGPHGNRFLNTFVNEIGFAEYVKFSEERGPMPTGTVIAKESFSVKKENKVRKGPLFFMEKVASGNADEYGNWVYSVIQPNGKPGKISQKFCHDCHANYSEQDALGYPDEDYRVSAE